MDRPSSLGKVFFVGLIDCLTPGGRWLRKRGRFAWLRLGLAAGHQFSRWATYTCQRARPLVRWLIGLTVTRPCKRSLLRGDRRQVLAVVPVCPNPVFPNPVLQILVFGGRSALSIKTSEKLLRFSPSSIEAKSWLSI